VKTYIVKIILSYLQFVRLKFQNLPPTALNTLLKMESQIEEAVCAVVSRG